MTYQVGLLYDSINDNTGDKAMGIVLEQQLKKHKDIKTTILSPFDYESKDYDSLIIGGGQLLRSSGDEYYDNFRTPGSHILNSIGLLPPVDDLGYLDRYEYVSARTSHEVQYLKKYTDKVELAPCMTTLLKGEYYDIPGVAKDETIVGIHIVPYTIQKCPEIVDVINKIPYKKVLIPFTFYNKDREFMSSLPFDSETTILLDELSPTQLHSVLGQMKYVIASSLHATIFAYSQNTPFATIGQEKTLDYFKDRDLSDYVFSSSRELQEIINGFETKLPDMSKQIKSDKQKLRRLVTKYIDIIHSKTPISDKQTVHEIDDRYARLRQQNQISDQVISGRDRLIGDIVSRSNHYRDMSIQQEAHIKHLQNEITNLRQINYQITNSKQYKLGWHISHPKGAYSKIKQKTKQTASNTIISSKVAIGLDKKYFLDIPETINKTSDTAVVLHLYYTDAWGYISDKLDYLSKYLDYDLYISIPKQNRHIIDEIKHKFSNANIFIVPNRGRDVLPFIEISKILLNEQYQNALKIHTKKSTHFDGGLDWFENTIEHLIPADHDILNELIVILRDRQASIIGPADYYYQLTVNLPANSRNLKKVITDIYNKNTFRDIEMRRREYGFFAGTMFWVNLNDISPIIDKYSQSYFENESGQIDSTFAHSLERFFSLIQQIENRDIYSVSDKHVEKISYQTDNIPTWSTDHDK